jgi:hypothetical protein
LNQRLEDILNESENIEIKYTYRHEINKIKEEIQSIEEEQAKLDKEVCKFMDYASETIKNMGSDLESIIMKTNMIENNNKKSLKEIQIKQEKENKEIKENIEKLT